MYPIVVLALLPFLSSAILVSPLQSNSSTPFVLRALRLGFPIHLSTLNANDGHFWLGKATSSSCPAEPKMDCPTETETAVVVSGDGYATLASPPTLAPPTPLTSPPSLF
ncbi:hypothetical protein HO173_008136 [Letharia columbiana]|uniref:Uncharacterized protein n=1 Tax=Letharia columbiana TaxID=112416 RepID=A0A8H6L2Z8_9LECA|nr:uncharacterized protein HO173_008136 [Letharia columbiana]KAF6233579.1 hypothetical protein HO173_008136 [Letharia columbiana]